MTGMLFNETINGASLIQIHDSAYQNVIRAYHKGGSGYVSRDDLMTHLKRSMKKNMSFVPMEEINAEKGYYNAADKETGRKYSWYGVGVGSEFDDSFGEGRGC